MKTKHLLFRKLCILTVVMFGIIAGGCTLTPHANVGVDFYMNDGKLRARPTADVGVYGRP